MKTYKRIEKLGEAVNFVVNNLGDECNVVDVGTDHGYLAELLTKNDRIKKIIATDISAKSLSKLEKLIKLHDLQKIELKIGDGLEPVDMVDISVIAGIGGHEIIKILKNQNMLPCGKKKCDFFVLQPVQNVNELRKWLFKNKIKVLKDYIIQDSERFYPIIIVDVSKKQRNKSNLFNVWLGRDNSITDSDFVEFIKELKLNFEFIKNIDRVRIRQDKVLYQKYKLLRIIDKLLKMCYSM